MADEALTLATEGKPQAILFYIQLPDHSCLYVLDQLKSHPDTRHIPVHIISGHDFSRQALQMGAIGFALKPIHQKELIEAFDRLEAKIRQDIRRVLIVEDHSV